MDIAQDDPLSDFSGRKITLNGVEKRVYTAGIGPAVIVMAEMPGISPQLARFARWLCAAGFSVYMPSLFGRDGAVPQADEGAAIFRKACISAEFRALGAGGSSPVTLWLRALAAMAHRECGGPGVGAIGFCFTGGFALSLMLEPAVLAPVVMHPSLPLDDPGGIDISARDLAVVRARLEAEDLTVQAYRFEGDLICRAARFETLQAALGKRFVAHTLPDTAANPESSPFFRRHVPYPHSVITVHMIDAEGQATRAAKDDIIAFLTNRLLPKGANP